MNKRRQSWRRWGIRLLKAVAAGLALLCLGFLLIQVLLATPWMRGKVAGKLSHRIGGQDVAISDLSWTPWSGARVHGLRVIQPKGLRGLTSVPLLEVDEVHAWPDYAAALQGEWRAHEVTVVRPKMHVTVEMLISMAASSMPRASPPVVAEDLAHTGDHQILFSEDPVLDLAPLPPIPGLKFKPVSADEPETPAPLAELVPADIHVDVSSVSTSPREVIEKPIKPEPELAPEQVEDPPMPVSDVAEVEAPARDDPKPEEPEEPDGKGVRVRIEDASFELIWSGRADRLAAIEGLDLDLPLFVGEVQTSNSIALMEFLGQVIDEKRAFRMMSRERTFSLEFSEEEDSRISGKVRLGLQPGLPVQVNLKLRLPTFGPVEAGGSVVVDTGEVSGRVDGGGWLLSPGSLSGVAKLEVDRVVGEVSGQKVSFDSGSGELMVSGGLVQSPDFRLIGDSASLLGNGWMTSRGGAAVVRVVVPFALVGMLNQKLNELVPESVFAFRPLKPDNRWYSDVSLWRGNAGWMVGFGEKGTMMPLDGVGGWGD